MMRGFDGIGIVPSQVFPLAASIPQDSDSKNVYKTRSKTHFGARWPFSLFLPLIYSISDRDAPFFGIIKVEDGVMLAYEPALERSYEAFIVAFSPPEGGTFIYPSRFVGVILLGFYSHTASSSSLS